jgi:plastocyanin
MTLRTVFVGIVVGFMLAVACSSIPDTSRTGVIHDIKIMESALEPPEITVRAGDEIRWINYRTKPVRIVFLDRLQDVLMCDRAFTGAGMNDTTIKASKAASLCFARAGSYKYNARMEAEVAGGEIPALGIVHVQ